MSVLKLLKKLTFFVLALSFCLSITLYLNQRNIIYHARPYTSEFAVSNWIRINYSTSQGSQTAFLARSGNAPPLDFQVAPKQLWLVFSGNASNASYWENFIATFPEPNHLFLLFDYPGYGFSEGKPTVDSILESSLKGFQELKHSIRDLQIPYGLIGHSLGAATGLKFATAAGIEFNKIILLSPFTSTPDMARLLYGWPLCLLLTEKYDNVYELSRLTIKENQPKVSIIHGTADNVIPFSLGEKLAKTFGFVKFLPIEQGSHSEIFAEARTELLGLMLEQ